MGTDRCARVSPPAPYRRGRPVFHASRVFRTRIHAAACSSSRRKRPFIKVVVPHGAPPLPKYYNSTTRQRNSRKGSLSPQTFGVPPGLPALYTCSRGHGDSPMPDPNVTNFYGVKDEYGLSNFATYPITVKKKRWPTSEHYSVARTVCASTFEISASRLGDTSCGCPAVSFPRASTSVIRSFLAIAAATIAGDRLIPALQATSIGVWDAMKLAIVSIAARRMAGWFPAPSSKGKRQYTTSLGNWVGGSSMAKSTTEVIP